MPQDQQRPGGRVALLDPAELDASQRSLYDQVLRTVVPLADKAGFQTMDRDHRLVGPFNPMLFSSEISRSFLALQKTEEDHTSLSKRVRQVIILSTGAVWRAPYELYAHAAVARAAGLDDETIDSLKLGGPCERLSNDESIAQRFTLQLAKERAVGSDLFIAAQHAFADRGILEMLVLIACYQAVCSVLSVFEVPAPTPDITPTL